MTASLPEKLDGMRTIQKILASDSIYKIPVQPLVSNINNPFVIDQNM